MIMFGQFLFIFTAVRLTLFKMRCIKPTNMKDFRFVIIIFYLSGWMLGRNYSPKEYEKSWNELPREVVELLSLEVFKKYLLRDMV